MRHSLVESRRSSISPEFRPSCPSSSSSGFLSSRFLPPLTSHSPPSLIFSHFYIENSRRRRQDRPLRHRQQPEPGQGRRHRRRGRRSRPAHYPPRRLGDGGNERVVRSRRPPPVGRPLRRALLHPFVVARPVREGHGGRRCRLLRRDRLHRKVNGYNDPSFINPVSGGEDEQAFTKRGGWL